MKYIIILVIVFTTFLQTYGQLKEFPSDPKGYYNEMKNLLESSPNAERASEAKTLMNEFKDLWLENPYFTDVKKKNIYNISNLMLKKKAKAHPTFYNYIKTLVLFSNNSNKEEHYDTWEKAIQLLCSEKKYNQKALETFVEQTYFLFSENSIYKTNNVDWKAYTNNFAINTDNSGIKLIFKEPFNMVCYAKRDSLNIYGTQGVFYPLEDKWVGANGKVTWERAGYDKNKVFAQLRKYDIDLKRTFYNADSVQFVNTNYFDQPIYGQLEDRVMAGISLDMEALEEMDEKLNKKLEDDKKLNSAEKLYKEKLEKHQKNASYPRFNSYTKRFEIKDIYQYVDYDGGFTMRGASFIGTGTSDNKALLNFFIGDTLFLTAYSRDFIFNQDFVKSQACEIVLRLDTDSIYHPGLLFSFDVKRKTVSLYRNEEGMAHAPFFNSYHQMDMSFEEMVWTVGDQFVRFNKMTSGDGTVDKLVLAAGKNTNPDLRRDDDYMQTENTALFESSNFFRKVRFEKLQGMDRVHPLVGLANYSNAHQTIYFTGLDFAQSISIDHKSAKQILMRLSYLGLILYDPDSDEVILKDKMFNYLSSMGGKTDYDVIQFESVILENQQTYATLELLNYDLKIDGIKEIFLSDSQSVIIWPDQEKIKLKKNRDFEFDGKILAGYFLFTGKNFKFDYDRFKIRLTDVEYAKFQVPTGRKDAAGNHVLRTVKTNLEDVRGELYIDNPNNKSGVKKPDFPQFPILDSEKDCYVYYDNHDIFKGVYNRNAFFFQIYPFQMDSLNSLTKHGTKFGGKFVSAGILPVFEDSLFVQPDYSLGLIRSAPPEGWPTYGGKGVFKNDIKLSNAGLEGNGKFEYINSVTESESFLFFPDSINAEAKNFTNKKQKTGVQFPEVTAPDSYVHFEPKNDKLFTTSKKNPIRMFDGETTLKGTTILQPTGMAGKGTLDFENATLTSDLFNFQEHEIKSDSSSFSLKDVGTTDFAFKTENVTAHVDFEERLGLFQSNGEASFVEFPQNQYICYMDQFKWFMDKEEIEMSAKEGLQKQIDTTGMSPMQIEDVQLSGSDFISIHPNQDSLRFKAPSANYNLRKKIITANEVKWIRVADATIYPGDGEIVIEKRAVMQTLTNSKIIANNATKYHTIYNASTNVYGRKDYSANGDYDYVDENNNKQIIRFDVVSVDSSVQTFATGSIGITENFTLSPAFKFTGKVKLEAAREHLFFDGGTMLSHDCEDLEKPWVKFSAQIDPNEIYIPVSKAPLNINNLPLGVGMYESQDSSKVYPAFLSKLKNQRDHEFITADGFMHFEKATGKYKISNKEKLVEFNLPGNYMSIHKSICNAYAEGKLNMGGNMGQVKNEAVGSINMDLTSNTVEFDLLWAFDFLFDENAMKMMKDRIANSSGENVAVDRDVYTKGLYEILGKDEAEKIMPDLSLYGYFKKFPKVFEHTIFFTDLKMEWNPVLGSYTSKGPIGIGSMGNTQINKMVNGMIELEKKKSGDILTIYLAFGSDWFFFQYRSNQMVGISSVPAFNDIFKELKPEKCSMDVPKGQPMYRYWLGTDKKRRDFIKKFEAAMEEEDEE
ncbi:MAG: hypothetical protein JXR58_05145 [Bacteroidales bacterium]|nr:hypothetical protein [Bacteroidales bacterium]